MSTDSSSASMIWKHVEIVTRRRYYRSRGKEKTMVGSVDGNKDEESVPRGTNKINEVPVVQDAA